MTNWEMAALILIYILASLALINFIIKLVKKEKFNSIDAALPFGIAALIILFVLALAFRQSIEAEEGQITNWVQIFLTFGLIIVTSAYAWSAHRQAKANEKMAEEAEEQRIVASRPVIIQRAVKEQRGVYFSNFEIYNAGNGPAIELTTAVFTEGKDSYREVRRETYLRSGVTPISFNPSNIICMADSKTYYLVSVYQGILSRTGKETRYETWLPFNVEKADKGEKVYVTAGELEFKEVPHEDSIENLIGRRRPQ